MIGTLIANNWFINILAAFFISLLDSIAYLLLAAGYNIFYAVSKIDIFGGTDAGAKIYDEITARIYTAISIIMVFVFAYYLIMMIVDPEGGKDKAPSALVKETVIAFITVILLPTVFKYMSLFQEHVITNNTIGNIILGAAGTSGDENIDYGKQVALIVFTSFYHPEGTAYADYFDDDGKMISDPKSVCTGGGADGEVCDAWIEGLTQWQADPGLGAIDSISKKSALYNTTNDEGGMYYMWIITTVAGVVAAWFFFSYAIDMGTRCVKLGFLQLIAPAPVLMKIFPAGKKTFDSWFAEIKKTYLEVFLRLAIIFFIIKLCTMVPTFITTVLGANNDVPGGFLTKALATVCLILGLLKFAKDAPQIFKTIFASGGGLFAGLDWKPGMKRRVSENEYAMKGIGAGVGAIGGLGTSIMAGVNASKRVDVEGKNGKGASIAYAAYSGFRSMPRGLIAGAKAGFKNAPTEFSGKSLANTAGAGLNAGQASEIKRQNNVDRNGHIIPINLRQEDLLDEDGNVIKRRGTVYFDGFKKVRSIGADIRDAKDEAKENISSTFLGGKLNNAAVETIKKATDNMDAVIKLKDVTNIDNAMKKLEEDIRTKGYVKYGTEYYSLDGGNVQLEDGSTVNSNNLKSLKEIFNNQKNKELAKTINDSYREGTATYMANVSKQLSSELANLGADNIAKINKKILDGKLQFKDGSGAIRDVQNINDFLSKLSNVKDDLTAEDMKVLKDVKTTMSDISKNIVITEQAKAAGKQQGKKDGNKA